MAIDAATIAFVTQLGATAILAAGHKKVWMFTHQHDDLMRANEKVIAELQNTITFQKAAYEARIVEKDTECERIQARLDKSEGYTDRLIVAAIDATAIASKATQAATTTVGEGADERRK